MTPDRQRPSLPRRATVRARPRSLRAPLLCLTLLAACVGVDQSEVPPADDDATAAAGPTTPKQDPPVWEGPPVSPKDPSLDRVLLTSGEWLFGEILELRDDTLRFDSDILDELDLDWDDVATLEADRSMLILLENRETAEGRIRIDKDRITWTRSDGSTVSRPRVDLVSFLPGANEESNYWSGGLTISAAGRSGNTDQIDSSAQLTVKRETASTRGRAHYVNTYSEIDGQAVTFNQRTNALFDVLVSGRLFVRPVGFEFYRDQFQGIDHRVTPSVGLGYEFLDRANVHWDVTAGGGWQRTKYLGLQANGSDVDTRGIAVASTHLDWDINDDVEFVVDYQLQAGFEGGGDVNHNLRTMLSVDLFGDFDLDVGFQWDRIGDPVPLEDGTVPVPDDYRVTVGLGWEF